jgi:predicted ribonuclease YlaK
MHDPTCLFRFDEHDLYLPIATLEELDGHKRGLSDVARNARQASRFLDEIVVGDIRAGLPIRIRDGQHSKGRLFLQTEAINGELPNTLTAGKTDNQILAVVRYLQEREPQREVVLVSKDINMRIKARALGLEAEDYFNDKVLEDADLLYTGVRMLPKDFWNTHGKDVESWKKEGHTYYRVRGPLVPKLHLNEFVFDESGERPLYALVKEATGRVAVIETLRDYTHAKNSVWGITARNREQNFALNLLMNPAVDFVTLLGQAGTGKTLLALAAGLTQVLDDKRYTEIIMTRVTVPLGEDIGFLPVDGRARGQPRCPERLGRIRRRVGTGRDPGPGEIANQNQVVEFHARPDLRQQVADHRRGAEPHAEADEDPGDARRPGDEGGVPGQHRPDRHALPHRGQLRPHLRGRPHEGLVARRARHARPRRALAPGGSRGGSSVGVLPPC